MDRQTLSARIPSISAKVSSRAMPSFAFPVTQIHWLVCHTKPRCEKKFAKALTASRIAHYLPLVESVRHYASGQKKRFTKPLFPSYVFAHVPLEKQPRIYEQQLLVRTLKVENERLFLFQIEQVKLVVASGLAVALSPLLQKGKKVRIIAGPLRGLEGIIDNPAHAQGIVVALDVLQQGVLVKIPAEQMEPLA